MNKLIWKNLKYLVITVRKQSRGWFDMQMGWSHGYFGKQIKSDNPHWIRVDKLYKASKMFHVSMEDLMLIDFEAEGIRI